MGILRMLKNRKRILGINERNLSYVKRYNSTRARKIVDDKLRTKKVLTKANIPTPKLLGQIRDYRELLEFDWNSLPRSFVIKPVSGIEGGGIEIFYNRDKDGNWIKADGSRWNVNNMQTLAAEILDGKYSLHNEPDRVFFEERVKIHKAFQYYAYKGAPDVRVIVFNSMPIMSYVRLPTKESNGKANLALGAIGVGIDIATGVTTTAVQGKSQIIETIPNTKLNVSGLKIPYWNKILQYAIEAQKATGLGFAAADFLIDRELGPVIVELNARPGLSIQISNQDGLRWRLRQARAVKVQTMEKGLRLAKDLFGGDIEEDIERISGKSLIGIYEKVTLYPKQDSDIGIVTSTAENRPEKEKETDKPKEFLTKAKIDTGADSTSIDQTLAVHLGYGDEIEIFNSVLKKLEVPAEVGEPAVAREYMHKINAELDLIGNPHIADCNIVRSSHGGSFRLVLNITMKLGDLRFQTKANIYNRSALEFQIIVGRKSLSRFLVEPSRTPV